MRNLLFILLCLLLAISCKTGRDENTLSIATYNMYLFFDGYEEGSEYSPFTSKNGYSLSVYEKRVKLTSEFFIKYFSSYDIIVVQEVENSGVLKDILNAGLKRFGFLYYGVVESSPFGVGYISKLEPKGSAIHQADGARAILELTFSANGEDIILYTLHAASQLDEDNESLRYETFSLLSAAMARNSNVLRIALGDFNMDLANPESGFAPDSSALSLTSPLVATGDTYFREGVYYSPILDLTNNLGDGTYFYLGEWSFLDNILISKEGFDYSAWEYDSSSIIAPYEAKDSSGYPKRFDISSSTGYSDHFALSLLLRYK